MKNLHLLIPKEQKVADRFYWATVTQVSPLTVRLDGDEVALDIVPDSLVHSSGLSVGSRVWCQMHARRLIILGVSGGIAP